MPKFPIIFGIIGKKLYLTIIYTLIGIIYSILKSLIPEEESISIINNIGGSDLFHIYSNLKVNLKNLQENAQNQISKIISYYF